MKEVLENNELKKISFIIQLLIILSVGYSLIHLFIIDIKFTVSLSTIFVSWIFAVFLQDYLKCESPLKVVVSYPKIRTLQKIIFILLI